MSHTPGPWSVDEWDGAVVVGPQWAEGGRPTIAECGAENAALIAAAPDLLAACKRVFQLQIAYCGDEIFAELRAAIAKADGKS